MHGQTHRVKELTRGMPFPVESTSVPNLQVAFASTNSVAM
jgi:hypothetical protein